MDIKELLNQDCIVLHSDLKTKKEVFENLSHVLATIGNVSDEKDYVDALMYRETLSETGLGMGIAIPHGKSSSVKKASIAFMTLSTPISDWPSLDDQPIDVVFQLAIPDDSNDLHIRMLSELARKLIHEDVVKALRNAQTPEDVYKALL